MKITMFDISGVLYSEGPGWVVDIKMKVLPTDRQYPHEVSLRVRFKGNKSETFADIEQRALAEAVQVLSQTSSSLHGATPDSLREDIDRQARAKADALNAAFAVDLDSAMRGE